MILTSMRPVNARLGKPSINAPNPRYLLAGEKVKVKSRVLGDSVNSNSDWILSEEDEYFSVEGFHPTDDVLSVPYYSHLIDSGMLFKKLKIDKLWDFCKSKGEKVNIGIIDSGVSNHPSLGGKVVEFNKKIDQCKDWDSHGTNMACIIAGLDESSLTIGISPMVEKIYSYQIKIDDKRCSIASDELLFALNQMDEANVHVLNMSFTCQNASFSPKNLSGKQVQDKINYLANKGCILVCSTGNKTGRKPIVYPASYDNVISVTGYNELGDSLNINSSYWNGVSVSMPVGHYLNRNHFTKSNGTSAGAAILSGIFACSYYMIMPPKISVLLQAFKNLPSLSDHMRQIVVPKFDTNIYVQQLNR